MPHHPTACLTISLHASPSHCVPPRASSSHRVPTPVPSPHHPVVLCPLLSLPDPSVATSAPCRLHSAAKRSTKRQPWISNAHSWSTLLATSKYSQDSRSGFSEPSLPSRAPLQSPQRSRLCSTPLQQPNWEEQPREAPPCQSPPRECLSVSSTNTLAKINYLIIVVNPTQPLRLVKVSLSPPSSASPSIPSSSSTSPLSLACTWVAPLPAVWVCRGTAMAAQVSPAAKAVAALPALPAGARSACVVGVSVGGGVAATQAAQGALERVAEQVQ
ncbi:unnamed protein product [Closterium sp. NIES-65]|nr:unnamed protein product [Closterium sp. NIES-65]